MDVENAEVIVLGRLLDLWRKAPDWGPGKAPKWGPPGL